MAEQPNLGFIPYYERSVQVREAAEILRRSGPVPLCPDCIWPEVTKGATECPDCEQPVIWVRVEPVGESARLRAALGAVFELAAVSWEGDPWYAEEAGIDGEAVLAQGRKALAGGPAEGEHEYGAGFDPGPGYRAGEELPDKGEDR
jgi:hypothetical protein